MTQSTRERSALAGPDADHNGVRDDVDAWIAQQFPQSAKARAVWHARALASQAVMMSASKEESRALSRQISNAIGFAWAVLEPLGWTASEFKRPVTR